MTTRTFPVRFACAAFALCVLILNPGSAVQSNVHSEDDGAQRLRPLHGREDVPADLQRRRELKGLAAATVGWTSSHIGPLRSVRMERLRAAFARTSPADIPILIALLSDKSVTGSTRQAVRYLLAMHGEAADAALERASASNPMLADDRFDIRLYRQEGPWRQHP